MTQNRNLTHYQEKNNYRIDQKNIICRQKLHNNYKREYLLNKDRNHEHGKKRMRQHKKKSYKLSLCLRYRNLEENFTSTQ